MSASPPTCTAQTLSTADKTTLHVRTFAPAKPCIATLVLVHGYLEHGGRYEAFAQALGAHGIAVVAADLRGHGLSSGARGHVHRFKQYREDLFEVLTSARLAQGPKPLFVLGHSLGGLIALDYALRKAPQLTGLMVTNPFIAPAMRIPVAKKWLGVVTQQLWPTFAVRAGLDSAALTRDEALLRASRTDPLIFDRTTARWFHEATRAQARVMQGGALAMPFLGILGMADTIASPTASLACFAAIHGPDVTVWQRDDERHEVLNELARADLFEAIAQWMLRLC